MDFLLHWSLLRKADASRTPQYHEHNSFDKHNNIPIPVIIIKQILSNNNIKPEP